MPELRLLFVLAHPDDESLGVGGTIAKYAREGVEVSLLCATRGERGRIGASGERPGAAVMGPLRERELRAAARVLGIQRLSFLGYQDGDLDRADPREVQIRIARQIRRLRPHVVVTFGPEGGYGHPDHIAISQFTAAALQVAASLDEGEFARHAVSKFYYMAWPENKWKAYQEAFKTLSFRVDGINRQATPWPDWAVTTVIDTSRYWHTVWRAIQCHQSQMAIYQSLDALSVENHKNLWGSQEFYRVFSRVNGGRDREVDLFEGTVEPAVDRSRFAQPRAVAG